MSSLSLIAYLLGNLKSLLLSPYFTQVKTCNFSNSSYAKLSSLPIISWQQQHHRVLLHHYQNSCNVEISSPILVTKPDSIWLSPAKSHQTTNKTKNSINFLCRSKFLKATSTSPILCLIRRLPWLCWRTTHTKTATSMPSSSQLVKFHEPPPKHVPQS